MIINDNKNHFQTSDLALASFLSLTYPIEKIDKSNPKRAEFVFKNPEELHNLIDTYWQGKARVEPQVFFNQLKIVKARLYGE
ncbi:MAG: hypothetical protein COX79_01810 [Candidatus Levybacteria bacterium CG_4_10_14_0_2_um_filter_36_16]|nr:MAG: hypothetical protein AUK12_00370 [Candidatus Levybacteria bacterium CG2_30_37_29]PIR79284.1 MAG: hypothetical protein COU26_02015 [Candidatus Levybacteria bacterium CG10_big_fil_rev_8_21_14_0_10_36_30]PIZ97569.1 MAG: hypothetical protein COX79_01810 [Candidatus Levybacteria bacterium CG_4_10_14_0_2_um_filter_36_16]